jgi:hypothetical protein
LTFGEIERPSDEAFTVSFEMDKVAESTLSVSGIEDVSNP